jgi:hypothetical protein
MRDKGSGVISAHPFFDREGHFGLGSVVWYGGWLSGYLNPDMCVSA